MPRAGLAVVLLVSVVLSGYGGLSLLDLLAREETRTVRTLALPADGQLALETGSGDVSVEASEGPPRVELVSQGGLFGDLGLRVVKGGDGRLVVRTSCGGIQRLMACSGTLRVLLGSGNAVAIDTGSGEIDVRGIRGGVVAETGSGDVTVTDVGGPEVSVKTGSGEIDGTGVAARRLLADTGSGDIGVVANAAPDAVTVKTGSGEVDLTVPDEVYDVSTDTGSGESRVTVRSDASSPRHVRVSTGSGDVRVAPAR